MLRSSLNKHHFFVVIILPHWFGWGISCLEKTQETPKHLISTYKSPKKTSQHIKFSHKKKCCGIEVLCLFACWGVCQMPTSC